MRLLLLTTSLTHLLTIDFVDSDSSGGDGHVSHAANQSRMRVVRVVLGAQDQRTINTSR